MRQLRGIPYRALVPNAVTVLALCVGLTGAWFAIAKRWDLAIICIVIAAILDALDGRIARMLKAQTKFGAELDSLSDVIAFGATPALVMYMWVMQDMPRFGWTISVFFVLCAALRLARFNARIDTENQPHKSAGFNTGVPSPPGAALALLPMMIWFETGADWLRDYRFLAPWMLLCALLMISNVATYSWSSIKVRRSLRFMALAAVGLFAATLVAAPWVALIGAGVLYAGLLPFSMMSYARVKKSQRSQSEAT